MSATAARPSPDARACRDQPTYFSAEKAVGVRNSFRRVATMGPSRSLSSRALCQAGSFTKAAHFVSRSASNFPRDDIGQIVVRFSNEGRPEAQRTDAVRFPDFHGVVPKLGQHIGHSAREHPIHAQLVDHRKCLLLMDNRHRERPSGSRSPRESDPVIIGRRESLDAASLRSSRDGSTGLRSQADYFALSPSGRNRAEHWSGRRESNPRMKLGKLSHRFTSHNGASNTVKAP